MKMDRFLLLIVIMMMALVIIDSNGATAYSAGVAGCKPAAVAPGIDLAACVAKEAAVGKSIAEIAQACAADVPAVINALVGKDVLRGFITEDVLHGTRAYGEAMSIKAMLLLDAGPP